MILPQAGMGPVALLSRMQGKLDAFATGPDGGVYTAAWEPGDDAWRGWWRIDGIEAAPGAPVAAVSRAQDKLDVFVVGIDGYLYAAAWEPGDSAWRGWWRVGDIKTTLHAPIAAVSRSTDKLDLFVTALDGGVYTAAWEPGDAAWRGWWRIGALRAPPGAPVCAVSRSQDKLDVFVIDAHGQPCTTAWEAGESAWPDWRAIGALRALPRTAIAAVSRAADKLDVFVVADDDKPYTAAWEPGNDDWKGWWPVADFVAARRATITAVSRSENLLDVFATAADGRVHTAAWQPGDDAWRGWWPIADGIALAGIAIGAVSRNADLLDIVVPGTDGRVYAAAWQPDDEQWRGWWTVVDLVLGMADPGVAQWHRIGQAFSFENSAYSEEAQGMTTDGEAWFLSSNGDKTIRKYGSGTTLLAKIAIPQGKSGGHVGAPGCFEGNLYVPIQGPHGVAVIPVDLSSQTFLPVQTSQDLFAWCDVNPLNGRLYTTIYDQYSPADAVLYAYDRETLARCQEDDLLLGPTPIHFDRIQGGVFTRHGRLIISRCSPNGLFCFSAANGYCFGGIHLGDYGSSGSEAEGVTVRGWNFGDAMASVHVLELDNDESSKDDCYLHSYRVPDPERL